MNRTLPGEVKGGRLQDIVVREDPAVLEPHPRKEDALVFGRRFVFFQILSLTLSIDSDGSTSSTPVKPASYVSFKRVPNLTKILMADLETCPIAASVK